MEDRPQAAARLVRFDKAKVRKHAEVSVPRPVAEPPFPDAQLAYHNNSKVGLNAARRERRGPPGVAARSRPPPSSPAECEQLEHPPGDPARPRLPPLRLRQRVERLLVRGPVRHGSVCRPEAAPAREQIPARVGPHAEGEPLDELPAHAGALRRGALWVHAADLRFARADRCVGPLDGSA